MNRRGVRVGLLLLQPWADPNPRHVDQGNGIHLLLLLVTMLDDETAAVMRADEGLRMDNCLLATSSECSLMCLIPAIASCEHATSAFILMVSAGASCCSLTSGVRGMVTSLKTTDNMLVSLG